MRVSVRPEDSPGAREGVFGLLAVLVKNANFAILAILVILGQVWGPGQIWGLRSDFGQKVTFWGQVLCGREGVFGARGQILSILVVFEELAAGPSRVRVGVTIPF